MARRLVGRRRSAAAFLALTALVLLAHAGISNLEGLHLLTRRPDFLPATDLLASEQRRAESAEASSALSVLQSHASSRPLTESDVERVHEVLRARPTSRVGASASLTNARPAPCYHSHASGFSPDGTPVAWM
eukprot:scaffold142650_cov32-Tisochrysis_lutea.AAC.8